MPAVLYGSAAWQRRLGAAFHKGRRIRNKPHVMPYVAFRCHECIRHLSVPRIYRNTVSISQHARSDGWTVSCLADEVLSNRWLYTTKWIITTFSALANWNYVHYFPVTSNFGCSCADWDMILSTTCVLTIGIGTLTSIWTHRVQPFGFIIKNYPLTLRYQSTAL